MLLAWLETGLILLTFRRPIGAALDPRFSLAYPDAARTLRAVLLVLAALLAVGGWFAAWVLHFAGVLASALITIDAWRSRSTWGLSRRLPPGSLQVFPKSWVDDGYFLAQAAQYGPVFKCSHLFRPMVCITGLGAGHELLRIHAAALESPALPFSRFVSGGLLRYMRGDQHEHYRTVFRRAFDSGVTQRLLPELSRTITQALAGLEAASTAVPAGVAPQSHLDTLMFDLWLKLFFGLRADSDAGHQLKSLFTVIQIDNPGRARPAKIHQAVKSISRILARQREDRGEPPPCLLGAISANNQDDARDPVVIANLIYLLNTTWADMSGFLCWVLYYLGRNPRWLEEAGQLETLPDLTNHSTLAARVVLETLRLRQSEFIFRATLQDIEFRGFLIPRGWLVRICVWESHRDPKVFAEPDQFNPDRFRQRRYSRDEYSPLGSGGHACIARQLVLVIGSVFVTALARGYFLHISSPGTPELGFNRHWTPGRDFRVRLEKRT